MASRIPLAPADVELQLSTAISVGSTSFSLSSANDDDGNALPSGTYCFTLDNGSTNKEYLMGTLNGTNVTSVVSVSRQGVETSGAVRSHRVGTPCIISDFATILRVAAALNGTVDLNGAAPIGYDAEPTLSDRKDLATVGYVLDNITGGTVAFDAQTIGATAGETVVAGELLYFNTTDQEWYKTDADTAATVEGVQLGIALGSGSNGVAITGGVQISGQYTTSGLTAGATYYASNTAGAYGTSAGTTSQVIGVALSTTKLLMVPRNPQIPTTDEKAAMAGDGGTPSASNPFSTRNRTMTAGATIAGATTPVPVYQNKTDNEFYACDANDTSAMKFLGFAISNGTDGNPIEVQFTGIVGGFTGLQEGEKYYVQDTAGSIGTTIGTYEILVGVAISTTELLIQKGKRRAAGSTDISAVTASGSQVITCGFRPSRIKLVGFAQQEISTLNASIMNADWVNGVLTAGNIFVNVTGTVSVTSARLYDGGSNYLTFSITSVTDTGFTITYTETGTFAIAQGSYSWEAEGEL